MTTTIQERRPTVKEGSIHCPVREMKHNIRNAEQGYPENVVAMIKQLRAAYPTASRNDKAEYLWLGRRYQEAYARITGAPLPKDAV